MCNNVFVFQHRHLNSYYNYNLFKFIIAAFFVSIIQNTFTNVIQIYFNAIVIKKEMKFVYSELYITG